ncbi:MAG: response regulator, partial [Planctomycetota bacterium]
HASCHCNCGDQAEKRTVLLVDDDADYLFQQKRQLESAGFEVISAEGETAAHKLLEDHTPDVAVVDLMMEQTDAGFSLCHNLRKRFPQMPIILVSSVNSETGLNFDASTDDERAWIKADAFLAKPIRFEQLKQQIDRLLAAARAE